MVDDFDEWYSSVRSEMAPALAAWCGDPGLAADALDEAFTRAFERWNHVRHLDSPAGWVWRTATNVVRRRLRRAGHERHLLRRQVAGRPHADIDDDLDLRRALLELTERQRTVIILAYIADLPHRDIADALGLQVGTVAATASQARARLAEILGGAADLHRGCRWCERHAHLEADSATGTHRSQRANP